ncbi:hypothetical protein [Lutimonas sp.]|uniref:hypothetical protein n=1 Tax=Lutimonas sp. TaxID=1872403 RepID=UPI003D9B779E
MNSQYTNEELPYREIAEPPEEYSAGAVLGRMVDGLGFRYYWASEGLTQKDLNFKPSEDARTTSETIDHILGLSTTILNSAIHKPNEGNDFSSMTFEEKRAMTLTNLKRASDIFRSSEDISEFTIVFKRAQGSSEYPIWNHINGPIADAIWHCGQLVSFRRSSGNPFNSKASMFQGKLRD